MATDQRSALQMCQRCCTQVRCARVSHAREIDRAGGCCGVESTQKDVPMDARPTNVDRVSVFEGDPTQAFEASDGGSPSVTKTVLVDRSSAVSKQRQRWRGIRNECLTELLVQRRQ